IRDYAAGDQVIRKVATTVIAQSPMPIPARIIIGSNGAVRHVHVIRATDAQRKGIEEALRQWTFKPHTINGRAVEVETGLALSSGGKVTSTNYRRLSWMSRPPNRVAPT